MDLRLKDARCLVTGAGSGLGHAIARVLAAEGARLAVAGRDPASLATLVDAIAGAGGARPECFLADLATRNGSAQLGEAVLAGLERVDVLVNNAGGSRPIGMGDEDAWEESFALNFTASRRLAERLLPGMRKAGYGRIINITGALAPRTLNAAAPAKAALQSWSRSLASEVARDGITVNCIAPGRFATTQIMTRLHPTEESRQAFIDQNIPIGRFGEPEELAGLVAFLASPLAGYISGATIPVDGAMLRLAM